jgi:uncharacterized repeat protein (TIGR01451 family)
LASGVPDLRAEAAGSDLFTTFSDFNHAGVLFENTFIRENGGADGASITLLPAMADHFDPPSLNNSIWTSGMWSGSGSFTPVFNGGVTIPANSNAFIHSINKFGPPTENNALIVEFQARFSSTVDLTKEAPENIGFGLPNLDSQFIVFSTFDPTRPNQNSGHLYARIKNFTNDTIFDLGTDYIGSAHRYRIDWFAAAPILPGDARDRGVFYVDGVQVADLIANNTFSHIALPPLYVYISNKSTLDPLSASNIQASPTYKPSGTYTSSILDAGTDTSFTNISWVENTPVLTDVTMETSSSPDQVYWTPYIQVSNGAHIPGNSRYLKYRLSLSSADVSVSPLVDSVSLASGIPQADLNILKSASSDAVSVNGPYAYTLSVHNYGPDSAGGLLVSDSLPSGVTYTGFDPSSGWNCTKPAAAVLCSYNQHGGALGSGETSQVTINVSAPASIGSRSNQAILTAVTSDSNPANNTSNTVTTTFTQPADLALDLSASRVTLGTGQPLRYTIHLTNLGPNQAESIQLINTLPNGITLDSVSGVPDWTCGVSQNKITCTLPALASGTSPADIQINVTAPPTAAALLNTAVVTSQTGDPNPANNNAQVMNSVVNLIYLALIAR